MSLNLKTKTLLNVSTWRFYLYFSFDWRCSSPEWSGSVEKVPKIRNNSWRDENSQQWDRMWTIHKVNNSSCRLIQICFPMGFMSWGLSIVIYKNYKIHYKQLITLNRIIFNTLIASDYEGNVFIKKNNCNLYMMSKFRNIIC